MIYKKIGKIETPVSAVGMGCWNIGNQWGEMTDEEAIAIVQAALDHGVTLFDVADSYGIPNGESELRLGKALKGKRDQVVITSKVGNWGIRSGQGVPFTTPDMVRLCGYGCLGRLRVDYLDILLCHKELLTPEEFTIYIEGFRALREDGAIKEFGLSSSKLEGLKLFYELSDGEMSVVEADYSLLHDDLERDGFIDFCVKNNISILTRGPLHQGILADKYTRDTVFTDSIRKRYNEGQPAREEYLMYMDRLDALRPKLAGLKDMDMATYAIRYLISQEANVFAIPGATSEKQIIANANAGARLLTPEELAFVK